MIFNGLITASKLLPEPGKGPCLRTPEVGLAERTDAAGDSEGAA